MKKPKKASAMMKSVRGAARKKAIEAGEYHLYRPRPNTVPKKRRIDQDFNDD